jgi:hypothetical protein
MTILTVPKRLGFCLRNTYVWAERVRAMGRASVTAFLFICLLVGRGKLPLSVSGRPVSDLRQRHETLVLRPT